MYSAMSSTSESTEWPYKTQPKDHARVDTETSIYEAAPSPTPTLLQWTLWTLAEAFNISSLHCFTFIGYHLHDNL